MPDSQFVQDPTPPAVEDSVPPKIVQSHTAGGGQNTQMSENVYSQHSGAIQEADSTHETMMNLARQNSALLARLERFEKPQEVTSAPAGGAPVAHHLHLVDGRTVVNHGGIGTHWSETLPDGTSQVTRIKEYFPAVEPDPSTLNA